MAIIKNAAIFTTTVLFLEAKAETIFAELTIKEVTEWKNLNQEKEKIDTRKVQSIYFASRSLN